MVRRFEGKQFWGASADKPTLLEKFDTHSRLLRRHARRELAAMQRLSEISRSVSLANDAWRLMLLTLTENLRGGPAYATAMAQTIGLKTEIVIRYLHVLEAERMIVLGKAADGAVIASIGDEGLLRIVRFFLPSAAND